MLQLKSEVDSRQALHHRAEIEAPAANSLQPGDWPPSDARSIVEHLTAGRWLVEQFALRQRRAEREVPLGGARVLLSVDEVRVSFAGASTGDLRQLEVELLDGQPAVLRGLDRRLRASGLLRPQPRTKMALAGEIAAAAAQVHAADPWVDAGRKVLRRHLLRMLEREPLVRSGDAQALKQMRVATRRSRATWRLFRKAYRRAARRRHMAGLRELGDALGSVRDLDVLLQALPSTRGLGPLRQSWTSRREAAFAELLARLETPAHADFVSEMLAFTERREASRRPARGTTVADLAAAELLSAYARLVGDGAPPADSLADEEWHALRIASRRLRYAIEALREVIGAERAGRLVARLVAVQDHLGALNDAVVTAAEVDAWLAGEGAAASPAARRAAESYRAARLADAVRLRDAFPPVWQKVAGRTFGAMLERALPVGEQANR